MYDDHGRLPPPPPLPRELRERGADVSGAYTVLAAREATGPAADHAPGASEAPTWRPGAPDAGR